MKNTEIERKFLIKKLPEDLEKYSFHIIEQGYLCTNPVVRVRKQDEEYYLTYKGKGLKVREEYNLPLTKEAYESMVKKSEGNIITKKRYIIPIENSDLIIELDVFEGVFAPLIMAEVEFDSEAASDDFVKPDWFGEEVTYDSKYHNCNMAMRDII